MNTFITLTDSHDNTFANCLAMIERHAPLMMKVGGACGFRSEQLNHGAPVTAEEKARIVELGRTMRYTPSEIAAQVGRSDTTVWRYLRRVGLCSVDRRRGPGARTTARMARMARPVEVGS